MQSKVCKSFKVSDGARPWINNLLIQLHSKFSNNFRSYEIKERNKIAAPYFSAIVLACVMIGLAIGSYNIGKLSDRIKNPLFLLFSIEIPIARALYISDSWLLTEAIIYGFGYFGIIVTLNISKETLNNILKERDAMPYLPYYHGL